jgi:hypothetical protein
LKVVDRWVIVVLNVFVIVFDFESEKYGLDKEVLRVISYVYYPG